MCPISIFSGVDYLAGNLHQKLRESSAESGLSLSEKTRVDAFACDEIGFIKVRKSL
jgi:hypothetical protein